MSRESGGGDMVTPMEGARTRESEKIYWYYAPLKTDKCYPAEPQYFIADSVEDAERLETESMKKVNWRSIAKKRWSKAEWITGNGPYALLAWCRVLTVTLWSSLQEAHRERELIDQIGCGGEDEVDRVKGGVGWIQGCPAMILIRGWPEPGSSAVTRRGNR